ncbi:hypothetical protein G7Y89_g2019 [Cudoniella acicularis]|uniref:Uncharacterized protein n=1 Tax=Cudoniella acicularis TaxID=354080 RepID=A0A8H4RW46_9HELO|nr:hypothetical protein G7Y89_g2019 [Cudoniella acicularis]
MKALLEVDDFCRLFELFKTAVTDLDTQYLEIRRSRKELFMRDGPETPGCDVDINDPTLLDEMINWDVDEPGYGDKEDDEPSDEFNGDADLENETDADNNAYSHIEGDTQEDVIGYGEGKTVEGQPVDELDNEETEGPRSEVDAGDAYSG